jgi:hypothetical protein
MIESSLLLLRSAREKFFGLGAFFAMVLSGLAQPALPRPTGSGNNLRTNLLEPFRDIRRLAENRERWPFLEEKPLEYVLSVYINSENAIGYCEKCLAQPPL